MKFILSLNFFLRPSQNILNLCSQSQFIILLSFDIFFRFIGMMSQLPKCTPEEIEKKKDEAMKRRQNKP